jgi:uncharacterized protein
MIVVSNTSPLTNLAAIGQFDLLERLYARLHIADGVWAELGSEGRHCPGRDEVSAADWIERHAVRNQDLVTALQRDLHQGEAETIALALEIGADLVLLDEKEARHLAQRLGLRFIGVVGLLIEAKTKGHIAKVRPCLDKLRQEAGFYLSDSVYRHAMMLAQEE